MSCDLDPIVRDYVLEGDVATESRQASFSGEVSNGITFNIFHAKLFEGCILVLKGLEVFIDLVSEEEFFEVLEGEVVELEDAEVALDEPRVFILLKFSLGDLAPQVPYDLVDQSGNVQSEKIDEFVYDCSSSVVVHAHEL